MYNHTFEAIAARSLDPQSSELLLAQSGDVSVFYSPFDHVRYTAKVAIVGITPGAQQSANALAAAHSALKRGDSLKDALRQAKDTASFSGAMRSNLVAMLDHVGVAKWLDISSTASLWGADLHLAHFTSVLRYPVFVGGKDYGGSSPDMLTHPLLRQQIDSWFGEELRQLSDVLWVPLGDKVARALSAAAERSKTKPRVLEGLPHPSGANAERIAYFLGRKARESLSAKTNAAKLDAARARAETTMRALLAG